MDGWEPLIGVVWVFGWAILIFLVGHLRAKRRQRRLELIHEERMKAMEKGVPLPELPELAEATRNASIGWRVRPLNPRWPLGVGALSISVGLGASLAMYMSGDAYHNQIWPFGLLGVFFGVGLFLHYALTRTPKP